MFARALYSPGASRNAITVAACALVLSWLAPAWGVGPHQRRAAKLTSTQRTEYRIVQKDEEKGTETIEKKVFDNNTVVFTIDATMVYGPGVSMSQHIELTVEEESYFPRLLHVRKNVVQPDSTAFEHTIDVEMFSNVAVVTSKLNNQAGTRRAVVPTGVALTDVGVMGYLYQTLFWYDQELRGGQRFQYLDPLSVTIGNGELKLEKEETVSVLGKKTRVNVFKFEREKLGPATLWVDKQGTIVRGEQNFFVYELVSRKNS